MIKINFEQFNFQNKVKRGFPTSFFIALFVLTFIAFTGIVQAKTKTEARITFNKDIASLSLDNKITEIKPGLANADLEKLSQRDPEAIKAYIQEVAPQYGVDWKLAYAIGAYESGYFKSNLAQTNNNFFGRKETSTTWRKWNTPDEAIHDQMKYLKERYIDRGLDTPAEMNHIYCEGNSWQYKVQAIMNGLT